MSAAKVRRMYRLLLRALGPRHWWPGETPFEVMVGAVLTQNTAWKNVERAITNLRDRGWLTFEGLRGAPRDALAGAIRPAGYFNVKAQRLTSFLDWLDASCGGDPRNLRGRPTEALREELLGVRGIGPETADSILLYALGRPVFVVDAYTVRVLRRHALSTGDEGYEEVRTFFEDALPRRVSLYNEYHALFVAVGKDFCRPRAPRCAACPLRGVEPIDPEA